MPVMTQIVHFGFASCFDPEDLPVEPWLETSEIDEVIEIKTLAGKQIQSNSLMIELELDGWISIDGHAYPISADNAFIVSLKSIENFTILGSAGLKYRWCCLNY